MTRISMTKTLMTACLLTVLSGPALALGTSIDFPVLTFPTKDATVSTQGCPPSDATTKHCR